MKISVEDIAPGKKKLSIEVSSEEVSAMLKESYKTIGEEARVEGFRKGKIPPSVLRQKFGKHVMGDAGSRLVEKTFPEALKEKGLVPLSSPSIEVEKLEEGSPFIYSVMVDVRTINDVAGYKDIRVEKKPADVTEEDVIAGLNSLRERNREFKETQGPAKNGDMVTVDFECMVEGVVVKEAQLKDYTLILGEGARFPEFEDAVKGVSAGGKAQFKKTFPPGYHDKNLAGKEAAFTASVKGVKEKILPGLDDEFAKDLNCENLEELKKILGEEIKNLNERAALDRTKREVLEKLLGENVFEVPESFIGRYYTMIMSNVVDGVRRGVVDPKDSSISSEEAKKKYWDMATKQAKGDIILDVIADKENIQVTEEDVSKAISDVALSKNESPKAILEKLKKEGTLNMFMDGIRREKAFEEIFGYGGKKASGDG